MKATESIFKNEKVLVIGCGLLGSSLIKNIKKNSKKYLFMKNHNQIFLNKN